MYSFKIENKRDYQKFCNLSNRKKEAILKKLKKILEIDEYKRFFNEKKKILYLNNLIDYLDKDSIDNNLGCRSSDTFLLINRFRFINNLYINKDAVSSYFNSCFLNKKKYTLDDLNILFQETYKFLMNYFNEPYEKIKLSNNYNNNTYYYHQKMILEVSKDIYEHAKSKAISEEEFTKLAVRQTWSLAHEFAHTAINKYVERNNDKDNIFFRESVINLFDNEFYEKNHNNFQTEIEANSFALCFTRYLLKDILDEKIVTLEIDKKREEISSLKTNITKKNINDEYENILRKRNSKKVLAYTKGLFKEID